MKLIISPAFHQLEQVSSPPFFFSAVYFTIPCPTDDVANPLSMLLIFCNCDKRANPLGPVYKAINFAIMKPDIILVNVSNPEKKVTDIIFFNVRQFHYWANRK